MNAYEKEIDDLEYEHYLNEIYGTIEVFGTKCGQGTIIRKLDPTAFRCMKADEEVVWVCDECESEYLDEDEAELCCDYED